jgi:hypothetical protein
VLPAQAEGCELHDLEIRAPPEDEPDDTSVVGKFNILEENDGFEPTSALMSSPKEIAQSVQALGGREQPVQGMSASMQSKVADREQKIFGGCNTGSELYRTYPHLAFVKGYLQGSIMPEIQQVASVVTDRQSSKCMYPVFWQNLACQTPLNV